MGFQMQFHTDYALTCTEPHWELLSLSQPSKDLVRTPTPLWYAASNRCFEIHSRSDNQWQKILLYLRNISIKLPFFQQQHIWFLYSSFLQDSTAFSTAESCCSHLFCPSCCDGNLLVATYLDAFLYGAWCKRSLLASSKLLTLIRARLPVPLGLNLRRFTIHCRLCVLSVVKYRQLGEISYVRMVQW